VQERYLSTVTLDANTATVAARLDFPGQIEHIRRILPGTTNIVVVLGSSKLEVFLKQDLQREFAVFTNQLGLTWLDQYTLAQMQEEVGRLPPHTVIYSIALLADGAGVPYEYEKVIKALRATANAPIESMCESALGLGIVGGPLTDSLAEGQKSARVAVRILNGERAGDIHVPAPTVTTSIYDWRELRRWNISEDRLPPGSVVKFRGSTVWQRHRFVIVAGGSALIVQTGLIMGLFLSLRRSRKAERSVRESEERMKLAAGAAKLGMWEWDFATNKIWVDTRAWGSLGTQVDNGSDYAHFMQMVHPDDRDGAAQAVAEAIRGDGHYGHVHRRLLPDGQVRWIAAQARVEFDAKHKPLRMRGVGMDITAQRLAEERARESERQFLLIANSSPVMMWTSAPDKLCDFVNERWLKFRGRRVEQELGNGWLEGLHPEDCASCLKIYSEAFDARLAFTMEYRLLRHDGQYRWISDHGVPRYDSEKKFMGYIGSCVDVTEKKETEQEAQRTKEELAHMSRILMLGELAGSLAHELNQPLTAIVSSGEAAQRFMNDGRRSDEEVREALKDVVEQGQRAGEIIAGMRAMLKKDAGQMAAQDINAAIRRVLELVRSDLVIRGLAPTLRLDPHLPPVKGHGVQLQQVLLNLVINACDAMSGMPPGQGRLIIESRRAAAERVEVSITDSGPGFSDEMLEHAFEPFRTTKPKGLGLGLAICRSIITMHGGRLAVVNNNGGKGATLRFTLPAQKETGP
jgi:PAS domain S-box-containing protein